MITILVALVVLMDLLTWVVIFDVILSWLALAGVKRPKFVGSILDPMYNAVKKNIPTTVWPFELTPIILIFWFMVVTGIIVTFFPEVRVIVSSF